MSTSGSQTEGGVGMGDVLKALEAIQEGQRRLATEVDSLSQRLDAVAPTAQDPSPFITSRIAPPGTSVTAGPSDTDRERSGSASESVPDPSSPTATAAVQAQKSGFTSRIILTTYPKQNGIDPIPLDWGARDASKRGPVVVSRSSSTLRRRNAIGAHGGSYSIYFALAVASKQLNVNYRPDFTNTEPAANIGPFPQWGDKKKIVAMDPWGHLAPWLFADTIDRDDVDIRPTIAITKAHMKLPELEDSVRSGRLYVALLHDKLKLILVSVPDGKVCLNQEGELAVTKFAVEPVWYLPGVAERFGIGGLTVYCFGDPAKMSDDKSRLALRIHDECNGSDVFGSDICTCRPYLIFGIEEAVREAQNGGSVVYNARKRGEDRASDYFKRTENVAGVKDMRFQALMPDILHWLGIKKIDRMLSMSNMKYDAIVGQGIPIHERVELPADLIPADSRVEIDAKITAEEELKAVQGRMWDDIDH
ncbi:putative gtp cyclohydrolase ii protein [Eutypa lata UCREL1]|uniref:Putative gtp cyclohydrolase ii protein n=1 Tax=Eutypa lata (strain UCR-EL1) TaxID=1287681 RepID=M7SCN7_EUTLA|nr:putative gtp cyclohydrolase ii protein [Eutypa lata UCREL1]